MAFTFNPFTGNLDYFQTNIGFIKADGTVPLTADWDSGSFKITAETFESDVATGTAPLIVASTTLVSNFNADLLDGQEGSHYLARANHTGTININDLEANLSTIIHSHNGSFLETLDFAVTSDGVTITGSLQQNGGGDLTMAFSDGYTTLDCTPACTISLTAGSDTAPQKNYVYIPQSTKVLTVSTSSFPTSAEHIKVAEVVVQSASTVQTKGLLANRYWNDHAIGTDSQGHHLHAWERIRWEHSAWKSGGDTTYTITTNAGSSDNVDIAVTAATVYQLHLHTSSAFDTATGSDILVVNDSTTPYTRITDLNALLTDSAGVSMSGKYFNLVIWESLSSNGQKEELFVNLPSGSYNKQSDAIADVSGYTNFSIPADFRGYSFLVSRITLRHQSASGGTWTSIQETDLRGQIPNIVAGGGTAAITTEFADSQFKIFDDGDPTKEIAFQVSGITTGTTRTLTAPDISGTILLNLVEDTTPQLGGDLDLNGKNIDFPTTANISDCLDEDTMASDSATALATQQSIKAYVDASIGSNLIPSLLLMGG